MSSLFEQLHNGNWVEERYFDVHKIVHLGQIFSQTFIFFWQNTFCVDGDPLWCSFLSSRGSHNMETLFLHNSIHFPSSWFLQRVTHCSSCSSISGISRSNAIISHRISGSLFSVSSYLAAVAPGPCLAGFIIMSPAAASLPHSLPLAGSGGCCLWPSRAPSTGDI